VEAWQPEPEMRALAGRVLNRARLDLDLPPTTLCEDCNRPARECALEFLLGATPEQSEMLDVWCRFAGIRPSVVREWARKREEGSEQSEAKVQGD
jgi:hypothetical protein